jgi:hypothetical protein
VFLRLRFVLTDVLLQEDSGSGSGSDSDMGLDGKAQLEDGLDKLVHETGLPLFRWRSSIFRLIMKASS